MTDYVTMDGDAVYPCVIDRDQVGRPILWNGWACPRFTRGILDLVIADFDRDANPDCDTYTWSGDTLLIHSPVYAGDEGYADEPCAPDADGLYPFGGWSYTWSLVDARPDDVLPDGRPGDIVHAAGWLYGIGPDGCLVALDSRDPRYIPLPEEYAH